MTINNIKNQFKNKQQIKTASILVVIFVIISGSSQHAFALSYPSVRSEWEMHDADTGTRATMTITDPSIVTGTDYWWARSFVYETAYAVNPSYGAVGAGFTKYIPLGSSTPQTVGLAYNYNAAAASQSYSFGTAASSSFQYSVTYTSNSCWTRVINGGSDSYCITGMTWANPRYTVTANTNTNSIPGDFNSAQYQKSSTWSNIGSNTGFGPYCHVYDTTDHKIQLISGNEFKYGPTASSNSCTSGITDTVQLPG